MVVIGGVGRVGRVGSEKVGIVVIGGNGNDGTMVLASSRGPSALLSSTQLHETDISTNRSTRPPAISLSLSERFRFHLSPPPRTLLLAEALSLLYS